MINENKKRIIIVDDDDGLREIYAGLFRKQGFEVFEARDGIEGLDLATSKEGVAAIFTGIVMPRMDGFQMMEALKKQAATAQVPVFVSSHLGREEDKQRAKELGARDFIINGTVPPVEAVGSIIRRLGYGSSYFVKVDPLEMDAQRMIDDLKLPDNLICDNCGAQLALKLTSKNEGLAAEFVCSNCNKVFDLLQTK
jgi:two-component system chemotaxis response regulator CheY